MKLLATHAWAYRDNSCGGRFVYIAFNTTPREADNLFMSKFPKINLYKASHIGMSKVVFKSNREVLGLMFKKLCTIVRFNRKKS